MPRKAPRTSSDAAEAEAETVDAAELIEESEGHAEAVEAADVAAESSDALDAADETFDAAEAEPPDAGPDAGADLSPDATDLTAADLCVPDCAGKACGDDGCGGSCGECDDGNPCTEDACAADWQCAHAPVTAQQCGPGEMCYAGECLGAAVLQGRLSCGDGYTCAVRGDGTVWCWGRNSSGQLGNGTSEDTSLPVAVKELAGAMAVDAGAAHTCAVGSGGKVWCWGSNSFGQLGDGSTCKTAAVPVVGLPE